MAAQKENPPRFRVNVNLLFPQGLPQRWPIKLFRWLISYGRFLALAVEVLVIATFVLRFKLDSDLANLKERINEQIPFVESLNQTEAQIRQTQLKLSTIRKTYASSPNWRGLLSTISSQLPAGVKLTSINFDHSQTGVNMVFRLNGASSSNRDLATLLTGLKVDPTFQDINLTNVTFDQGQIIFTITGNLR